MTPSSVFVELDKATHNRKVFECGTRELNTFLQQFAVRHREAGISKTMVLPAKNNMTEICAYYTLSHTEIERQALPQALAKKLPHYPVPVMLIARLAIRMDAQGQGLGKITLMQALKHSYEVNLHLPSYAVVVDALDVGVEGFYMQYGFQPLDTHGRRTRLFMPLKTVAQVL